MAGTIISGFIFGLCALVMIAIGVSQMISKKPVGFYTGEKAPDANQLTDVKAWNKKHGLMWVIYGCLIIASWLCGLFIGDSVLVLIPFLIGSLAPLFFMVVYHHLLVKKYMVK